MVAWISPPAWAGGGFCRTNTGYCSAPKRKVTTPTMDRRNDARTAELNNLRLALAAFALQLAAFEMRLQLTAFDMRKSGRPLRAGAKSGLPAAPPDINCRPQKERLIGGQ